MPTNRPGIASDGRLDQLALLTPSNSIDVVDVSSGATIWTAPALALAIHFLCITIA